MKNEKTIICHSFPAWDTPYIKSTIELMTRLTSEYRVIFIDYHYTLKDLFKNPHTPIKQVLGKGSRWREISVPNGKIEIFNSAPILPINWISNKQLFKWAVKLNAVLLNWQIQKIVRQFELEGAILINAFNPIYGLATLDKWKSRKSIYYCYDEISGTEWSGKHGPAYEKVFLQKVDKVIVSSPKLHQVKGQHNPNTHLVPNGVNLDIFKPLSNVENAHKIGYVGAVDNRIDVELVNQLAQYFKDISFDFYGPIKIDESLFTTPNIKLHGSLSQEELPAKISEMDVCLIPFVKNNLTASIYPLKANEYLAMGKSVVATNFADLSDFEEKISIAKDGPSFIEAVKSGLTKNSPEFIKERIKFAHQNSWDKRTEQMAKHLLA